MELSTSFFGLKMSSLFGGQFSFPPSSNKNNTPIRLQRDYRKYFINKTKIECHGRGKSEYKEQFLEFRIITQVNNLREMLKDEFKEISHFYANLIKFSIFIEKNLVNVTFLNLAFCFLILVYLTKIVHTTV